MVLGVDWDDLFSGILFFVFIPVISSFLWLIVIISDHQPFELYGVGTWRLVE